MKRAWVRAGVVLAALGALACGNRGGASGTLDGLHLPEGVGPFAEVVVGDVDRPDVPVDARAEAADGADDGAADGADDAPGDKTAGDAGADGQPVDVSSEGLADTADARDVAPDLPPQPCTPYQADDPCGPGLQCLPTAAGEGLCQPAGVVPVDGACGTGVGLCQAGHTCLLEGPAGGRCVPFCDPAAAAGQAAACQDAARVCVDLGIPAFGICLSACDPWFVCPPGEGCAPPCPAGQACAPVAPEGGACYVVGTTPQGAACDKAGAWWACAPGLACLAEPSDASPTCQARCRPFGPASDCPGEGSFCLLKKTWLGLCATGALDLPPGAPCEPSGAWCGPNVRCMALGDAAPRCTAYCRVAHPDDCPAGKTCYQSYGADPTMGICL